MRQISRGFTLIEIVMAIVITGIISSVLAAVIGQGIDAWVFLRGQRSNLDDVRSVIHRLDKEITRTKDNSAASITTFTSQEYQFVDVAGQAIDYRQSGNQLLRNNQVILTGLDAASGLRFNYLNASNEAAAQETDIRVISYSLLVVDGQNRVSLRGAAGVRNR